MKRVSPFMAILVITVIFVLLALLSVFAGLDELVIWYFIIASIVFMAMLLFNKRTID